MVNILSINAQDASVVLTSPDSVIVGEDFQIKVVIVKGNNSSFAKLQLEIPKSFKIDSLESDSARFMLSDNLTKYIWDRMPMKDTLFVAFKATTDPESTGTYDINGHFSFILNEEKREIRISTKTIRVNPLALASAVEEVTPTVDVETVKESPVPKEADQEVEDITTDEEITAILEAIEAEPARDITAEEIVQEEPKAEVIQEAAETASIPQPEIVAKEEIESAPQEVKTAPAKPIAKKETVPTKPRIEFRVQIVASVVKVDISRLKAKYSLSEDVFSEFHNGLWKYTVGAHGSYSEAKNKLPLYRNQKGVEGAFITAYSNGERIGVGDAIKQTK